MKLVNEYSRKSFPIIRNKFFQRLAPYKDTIIGIVIESTYNWYWLVDALMAEGYKVHLANPRR